MNINLTRLRRFLAVYDRASFSRAADDLAMTHSALTKSVQRLELEIGAALLERTTRSVVPTEAGHRLAQTARQLLSFADQIGEEVATGKQHLRVVAGPAVIEASLAAALAQFRTAWPEVRVTAETVPPDIAIARLQRREVDLLVYHSTTVNALPARNSLTVTEIIDEPYVAVLRPDHPALKTDRSHAALLRFEWAIPGFDQLYQSALPAELAQAYRRAGFPHYRILSLGTCLALASTTDLITLLPESYVRHHAGKHDLEVRTLPFDFGARYRVSAIADRRRSEAPAISDFIAGFAASARPLARSVGDPAA